MHQSVDSEGNVQYAKIPHQESFYSPLGGEITSPSTATAPNDDCTYIEPADWRSKLSSLLEGGNLFDSTLTLLSATIGTGILMIPNALSASGTIWSSLQMSFCGLVSYFSLITLVKCANDVNIYQYPDLAYHTYGYWLRQAVNITCFFANLGSTILYLTMTIQLITVVNIYCFGTGLPDWLINPYNKIMPIGVATLFVLPLSITKELKALRYFSLFNVACICFFCVIVVWQGFDYQPISDAFASTQPFIWSGFTTTFPTAIFSYMCHTNVLDVFKELKVCTVKTMEKVIRYTVGFVLLTYVMVGVIGYATFSENLGILNNQIPSDGVILIAYGFNLTGHAQHYPIAIIICMITTILSIIISQPFNIKPAKDSLRSCVRLGPSQTDLPEETTAERCIYATITVYAAVAVVLISQDAQMILNIIGSSFFTLICFVFPSMMYLKIHEKNISNLDLGLHVTMVLANSVFTVLSTAYNIDQAFSPSS